MTEQKQPTPDQVLTASLKLIVDEFVNMGYEDRMIFGKVNLILQGFITAEGGFTDEYIQLAQQALDERARQEFAEQLGIQQEQRPQNDGTGIKLVVPGGGVGGVGGIKL